MEGASGFVRAAAEMLHVFKPLLRNTGRLCIEYSSERALKRLLTHPLLVAVVGGHPVYKCLPLIRRLLRGVGFTFPRLLLGKPDA